MKLSLEDLLIIKDKEERTLTVELELDTSLSERSEKQKVHTSDVLRILRKKYNIKRCISPATASNKEPYAQWVFELNAPTKHPVKREDTKRSKKQSQVKLSTRNIDLLFEEKDDTVEDKK